MNTTTWAEKQMSKKGWEVREISYERLRSGFKSVEGGWLCMFETEYDNDDCYQQIKAIKFDRKINGTIDHAGIIMAMTATDFRKLINKIPQRKTPPHAK